MQHYRIEKQLEVTGCPKSVDFRHRLGRRIIFKTDPKIGERMNIMYVPETGETYDGYFYTSPVVTDPIYNEDGSMDIKTDNSIYHFTPCK